MKTKTFSHPTGERAGLPWHVEATRALRERSERLRSEALKVAPNTRPSGFDKHPSRPGSLNATAFDCDAIADALEQFSRE